MGFTPGMQGWYNIHKSINKCWRGCGVKGTLVHGYWECRLMRPLWKTVWNFLRKLKMELPFHPAIPLLGLYPKNPETPIQKNLCTPMFIAAQFTVAKYWKQPKCPSANEWIKKYLLFLIGYRQHTVATSRWLIQSSNMHSFVN